MSIDLKAPKSVVEVFDAFPRNPPCPLGASPSAILKKDGATLRPRRSRARAARIAPGDDADAVLVTDRRYMITLEVIMMVPSEGGDPKW